MPDVINSPFPKLRQSAFSLLELIVTISIVVILMTLAAPMLLEVISTSRLTGSGDFVYNKLSQARQRAISDSRDIRVRILAIKDPAETESFQTDRKGAYREVGKGFNRLQFLGWQRDGSDEILTDIFSLDEGITISRNPKLSSLICSLPLNRGSGSQPAGDPPASYVEFAFHPDGSTDLPAAISPDSDQARNNWFLTVIPDSAASGAGLDDDNRPANFYCIQIDPDTGALSVYRP